MQGKLVVDTITCLLQAVEGATAPALFATYFCTTQLHLFINSIIQMVYFLKMVFIARLANE